MTARPGGAGFALRMTAAAACFLLSACPREPVPDAWVGATTLNVRPCVPDHGSPCDGIAELPFGTAVSRTGRTAGGAARGCTEWAEIRFTPAGEDAPGRGWTCEGFLVDAAPTEADVRARAAGHLADGRQESLPNDVLMLAELTAPDPFPASVAVGTSAAALVLWAREILKTPPPQAITVEDVNLCHIEGGDWVGEPESAFDSDCLPSSDLCEEHPPICLAWATAERAGFDAEDEGPLIWRSWDGPGGAGGFVLLDRTTDGHVFRLAGAWTATEHSPSVDLRAVAQLWEKSALLRILERAPDGLRTDASPAAWEGPHG